jgi:predicted nucleotidyltransferase
MTRRDVLMLLEKNRDQLRLLGVRRLGLFGSTARDEATPTSDLDFLVELNPKTFDSYMNVKEYLERLFGEKVDLVLENTLKPSLRDRVVKETVHAAGFEAAS